MRTIEATIVMRAILIARFRAFVRSCESRARVGGDAMGAGGDRCEGLRRGADEDADADVDAGDGRARVTRTKTDVMICFTSLAVRRK